MSSVRRMGKKTVRKRCTDVKVQCLIDGLLSGFEETGNASLPYGICAKIARSYQLLIDNGRNNSDIRVYVLALLQLLLNVELRTFCSIRNVISHDIKFIHLFYIYNCRINLFRCIRATNFRNSLCSL